MIAEMFFLNVIFLSVKKIFEIFLTQNILRTCPNATEIRMVECRHYFMILF